MKGRGLKPDALPTMVQSHSHLFLAQRGHKERAWRAALGEPRRGGGAGGEGWGQRRGGGHAGSHLFEMSRPRVSSERARVRPGGGQVAAGPGGPARGRGRWPVNRCPQRQTCIVQDSKFQTEHEVSGRLPAAGRAPASVFWAGGGLRHPVGRSPETAVRQQRQCVCGAGRGPRRWGPWPPGARSGSRPARSGLGHSLLEESVNDACFL